jgi:uncharacterized protein (TIGR03437 family)
MQNVFGRFQSQQDIVVNNGIGSLSVCGNEIPDGTTPLVSHEPCVFTFPQWSAAGTINSASYRAGASPGMMLTILGANLATGSEGASSLPLPQQMQGVGVMVNGVPAPLYYVSPRQLNLEIPDETATGEATLVITAAGQSTAHTVNLTAVAPGLFSADSSGVGAAAARAIIVAPDGVRTMFPVAVCKGPSQCATVPIPAPPATSRLFLELYATGIRHATSLAEVSISLGVTAAAVTYAGPQSQFPGLDQIDVLVPAGLSGAGEVEVIATLGGISSNPVRVRFE